MQLQYTFCYNDIPLLKKTPKADYIAYCADLAKQESAFLIENDMHGISFSDLFDLTVAKDEDCLSLLRQASYCILAHTLPEYDPDFSHVSVYLKNKYDVSAECFDVISHSEKLFETAHHLLSNLLFQSEVIGVIIIFSQPVVPVLRSVNYTISDCLAVETYFYGI